MSNKTFFIVLKFFIPSVISPFNVEMKYDKLPQFAEASFENYLQEVPLFVRLFF